MELASAVLPNSNPMGNLSQLEEVKDRLQCKDFEWYLHNVYPEQQVREWVGGGFCGVRSFIRAFVRSFVASFVRSFVQSRAAQAVPEEHVDVAVIVPAVVVFVVAAVQ